MSVRTTVFQPIDLTQFDCRDDIPNLYEVMMSNDADPTRDVMSVWKGQTLLAIVGINHLRTGVVEGWMLGSTAIDKFKLTTFRTMKKLIDFCFVELGVVRFQIAVDRSWDAGNKWATKLGLTFEGTAVKYDGIKDYDVYARVK